LFQPDFGKTLNLEQKQKFARQFYHTRGHFYEMLWFLGSLAPSFEYKKVVLQNITEEFGGKKSHENLYWDFAKELGGYSKMGGAVWAAFSAYEKQDNLDYSKLYELAKNFEISEKGLFFFKIHTQVQHFETTENLLQKCWESDREAVKAGFEFIKRVQMKVWQGLSEEVLI